MLLPNYLYFILLAII